jgi:hypothetical protein
MFDVLESRGVGFYFRNVPEVILFGVRGKNARTLAPGRRTVRVHRGLVSRAVLGAVRARRATQVARWGNQADGDYAADVEYICVQFGADGRVNHHVY